MGSRECPPRDERHGERHGEWARCGKGGRAEDWLPVPLGCARRTRYPSAVGIQLLREDYDASPTLPFCVLLRSLPPFLPPSLSLSVPLFLPLPASLAPYLPPSVPLSLPETPTPTTTPHTRSANYSSLASLAPSLP